MKKKIKIISASGLALLLVLTFVSRSAYNKNLPQVTACKIGRTLVPLTYETVAELYYENEIILRAGQDWRIGKVHVKNGDWVNEGDLLFTLDTDNHDLRVMSQKLEILRLQNSLDELSESVKTPETAELSAPFDGYFIALEPLKANQRLEKGTVIGRFVNDGAFRVSFPFISAYRDSIHPGMTAEVSLPEWMEVLMGRVGEVSEAEYLLDGARVFDVEVLVGNPGNLTEGNIAHITIDAGEEQILAVKSGTLRFAREEILTAPIGGIVADSYLRLNSSAREGDILLRMREESTKQDERALQRRHAELSAQLELAQKQAELLARYPTGGLVYAEADGYVAGLAAEPGDTPFEGGELLALLPDARPKLKFSLPSQEGEAFGPGATVSALIESVVTGGDGESTFTRQTVTGRVLTGILNGGLWECSAGLNSFDGRPVAGQDVPVQVTQKGETQDCVVPVSCIFDAKNNTKVVYAINTRPGLFGEESYLTELSVTVLYDNGQYASIDGSGIYINMTLAGDPSELINNGDVVWVRE